MSTQTNGYNDTFHSKIMLFGEYSIILGSMGLTIPYAHFNGSLGFINKNRYTDLDFAKRSNLLLSEYSEYIDKLESKGSLPDNFDNKRMKKDIANGLYFESTIPEGYGLGSSGALVAALYHKYKTDNQNPRRATTHNQLLKLKKELATLETWFHGTSSGIDPLICYMKHPLLLNNDTSIKPIGIPRYNLTNEDAIFLVNSGKPGKTAPLVERFMSQLENSDFKDLMQNQYTPLNNKCIKHLIYGELDQFTESLSELSQFQATHFKEMIPPIVEMEWIYGISTQKYLLKLCGSGGGGFVLGFTRNYSEVKERFQEKNMEVVPVYRAE
ncbi:mevalonate kinase family protein [Natronoflexus pectinivorans]|uniref:mevalonate kinase n=1 Tax=Natronoflexus pectinivorans TaxID=682526 RepID=A0A4R2GDJ1_9BACT|nr:mevalonate kinase [Natronoflexus pectinivorans]TCO06147.1 mevalonate kinase [Natronoflexus pectinivorans]